MSDHNISFEWGLHGIKKFSSFTDVIIIVDVLSFSTCVDIAVTNGAVIFPYPFNNNSAETYARENDAELASSKRDEPDSYSLSPSSLMNIRPDTRLVLPSPNGSELSLAPKDKIVLCASLRNCAAVAEYALDCGSEIAVIAAGEKWKDGSIRFAIEDFIGAGAVINHLNSNMSLEAEAAMSSFKNFEHNLYEVLEESVSGAELLDRGFEEDILLASELNFSSSVPLLRDNAYINVLREQF